MSHPTRILVILGGGAGDVLRVHGLLRAIRSTYTRATITLVCTANARPALEVKGLYDRIVARQPPDGVGVVGKALALLRLLYDVRGRFDIALMLCFPNTFTTLLARLLGRRSIGYSGRLSWLLSSSLGSWHFAADPVSKYRRLLTTVGVETTSSQPHSLRTAPDDLAARRLLGPGRRNQPLVVCHPGSDWACQQWEPRRWSEFADTMVERYSARIAFTGTTDEGPYIQRIRTAMRYGSQTLAGSTPTLGALEAVLARCDLCVTVDSLVHELAVSAGADTIVLVGPTAGGADWGTSVWSQSASRSPFLVVRMTPGLQNAINECRGTKAETRWGHWRCLDYACPMAGLRDTTVEDVLQAVEARTGWSLMMGGNAGR